MTRTLVNFVAFTLAHNQITETLIPCHHLAFWFQITCYIRAQIRGWEMSLVSTWRNERKWNRKENDTGGKIKFSFLFFSFSSHRIKRNTLQSMVLWLTVINTTKKKSCLLCRGRLLKIWWNRWIGYCIKCVRVSQDRWPQLWKSVLRLVRAQELFHL